MDAMLYDLILTTVLCSLFVMGMHTAFRFKNWSEFDKNPNAYRLFPVEDKYIFWFVRFYGSYLPRYFRKPLYSCPPCMASIYSLPVFYFSGMEWIIYPVVIVLVAGLNKLIVENLNL